MLSDKRKSALGSEISRFSSDLDGLASGFASEPAIQVMRAPAPGVVPIIEPLRFVLDAVKPEDASRWMFPNRIGGVAQPCRLCDQAQVQGKRVEVEKAGMRIAEA